MPAPARRRQGEKPKGPKAEGTIISDTYSEEELTWLFETMRAGGFGTLQGLIRTAVWNQARHMGVDIPVHVLALERRHCR